MNLTTFAIQLDNSTRRYYAGQYITGKIIVKNETEVPTRGIALRFAGTASLTWTETVEEGSGDALRNVVKRHTNKEVYMDEELYAFGRAGLPEDLLIPPGYHEYPFTYQLPPSVPSTFKFDQGQNHADVTYQAEAKIKRSAWKSDHKTNLEFDVNAVMNVKRYSQASQPVVVFKEKHLCCFCCKDGPITMNVKMPKSGYMPGDIMSFTVDIANFSSKRVSNIEASIEQETRLISSANGSEKNFNEVVIRAMPGPNVESNQKEIWKGEILIPPMFPTNLGGCHIILRNYILKVYVNIALSRGLKAVVPIVIGSAPPKKTSNSTDDADIIGEEEDLVARTPNYNDGYLPPDYNDVVNGGENPGEVSDIHFTWTGTESSK